MRFKFVRTFLLFLLCFGLIAGIAGIILLPRPTLASLHLDSKEKIMNRLNTGVILLDRNGNEFYRFYQGRHMTVTPVNEISQEVKNAVIAAEDRSFYSHNGYSIPAMAASAIADLRHRDNRYGGSTITQQLVKNSFLTPERSWQRKYQELRLARELEEKYTKDEILEMYLNSIYFGEGAFGIEEAAQTYFSVSAKELTTPQAAMLAGLLTAPSALSPISNDPKLAKTQMQGVLDQMAAEKYITLETRENLRSSELNLHTNQQNASLYSAPHFALMVRQQLIDQYGEDEVARSGFVIHITIDPEWQVKAEEEVKKQVEKLAANQATNGAAVVIDPQTSEVKALVGSKDWHNDDYGKVNVATSLRQPGSSFKPIVYLSALEKGTITPASILNDVPTTFGKNYKPENYDKRFRGRVTVRRSLSNSLNVPTVEVQKKVGVPATLDMAKRLGISTLGNFSPNDLSLSLGAGEAQLLEMTGAYATLANQGKYAKPVLIKKIISKEQVSIFEYDHKTTQVIDPKPVFLLTSILSDNTARKEVFGDSLTISRPAAAKTGTSQDYKDSWTIGYTPSLAIGVWVGNNDGHPMNKVAGSLGAAPIWRNLMEDFSNGTPVKEFSPPPGLVQVDVCRSQGLRMPRGYTFSDSIKEYFIEGSEPTRYCFLPTPSPSPSSSPSPESVPVESPPSSGIGGDPGQPEPLSVPVASPLPTPLPSDLASPPKNNDGPKEKP